MKHWLLKSEPSTFGIEHLARAPRRRAPWDGVRNYQARNMLRDEMKRGNRLSITPVTATQWRKVLALA